MCVCKVIRHLTSLCYCVIKALNTEIKLRRETVDSVLKDNVACVNCIKVRRSGMYKQTHQKN